MKKCTCRIILAIIPLIFFVFVLMYKSLITPFSYHGIDPEYAYLMNGVCLAEGNFDLSYHDHPGTPLQCLIAVSIKIAHLFSKENHLAEDVIMNPDHYMSIVSIVLIMLNSFALYFVGILIFLYTKNLSGSILLQFSGFSSPLIFTLLPKLRPESLLFFTSIALIGFTIYYLDNPDRFKSKFSVSILFAILASFGASVKITFIPFAVLPVFILKGIWRKIIYCISTIILFFIFSFPVLFHIVGFWRWITKLFLHTELYGRGETTVVDFDVLLTNIKTLFSDHTLMMTLVMIILVFTIFYSFYPNKSYTKRFFFYTLVSLSIALIIEIAVVCKHYKDYYILPFFPFILFGILIVIELVKETNIYPLKKYSFLFPFAIIVFIGFTIIPKQINNYQLEKNKFTGKQKTLEFIAENSNLKPIIIVPSLYNSAFKEYPLFFGAIYAGKHRFAYYDMLKTLYSKSYVYNPWDSKLYFWSDENITSKKIWDNHKSFYVYFSNKKKGNQVMENIIRENNKEQYDIQEIFTNEITKEAIFFLKKTE